MDGTVVVFGGHAKDRGRFWIQTERSRVRLASFETICLGAFLFVCIVSRFVLQFFKKIVASSEQSSWSILGET